MSSWTQFHSLLTLTLPSPHTNAFLQPQHPSFQKNNIQTTPAVATTTTPLVSTGASPEPTSHSSWIEALRSHTRSNQFREAISTYIDMMEEGIRPNNFAFPAVMKAATGIQDFNLGKQIHAAAVKLGYTPSSVTVTNTFVNLYGKCGKLEDVLNLFERMPQRDQVSRNSVAGSVVWSSVAGSVA